MANKKIDSVADVLLGIHYSHLCGGSCIEDLNTFNEHIGIHADLLLPSADTALRVMQEVKTEDIIVENGNVTHQFNRHDKLNDCLQKLAVKTNAITASANNILDFDNVILENGKHRMQPGPTK